MVGLVCQNNKNSKKHHFVPQLLGRRKISLPQAGAKTNESIEKRLFYTDENPTILDRVNRHKRCLDTRKSATHDSPEFKYSITLANGLPPARWDF